MYFLQITFVQWRNGYTKSGNCDVHKKIKNVPFLWENYAYVDVIKLNLFVLSYWGHVWNYSRPIKPSLNPSVSVVWHKVISWVFHFRFPILSLVSTSTKSVLKCQIQECKYSWGVKLFKNSVIDQNGNHFCFCLCLVEKKTHSLLWEEINYSYHLY